MFNTLIRTEDLARRLGDADVVVCDVRHDLARADTWGEAQYREAHMPGAVFVHLDRDLSGAKTGTNGRHPLPMPQAAAATFARLGIGPGTQVVAYDQGQGMFAARLWWMLRWLGIEAVAVLDGGFAKWTGRGSYDRLGQRSAARGRLRDPSRHADGGRLRRHGQPAHAALWRSSMHAPPSASAARRSRWTRWPATFPAHATGLTRRTSPPTERFKQPSRCAPSSQTLLARRQPRPRGPPMRVRRHRMPQPARDGDRRFCRHASLPGLLERVVRRSGAAGRNGSLRAATALTFTRERGLVASTRTAGPAARTRVVKPRVLRRRPQSAIDSGHEARSRYTGPCGSNCEPTRHKRSTRQRMDAVRERGSGCTQRRAKVTCGRKARASSVDSSVGERCAEGGVQRQQRGRGERRCGPGDP